MSCENKITAVLLCSVSTSVSQCQILLSAFSISAAIMLTYSVSSLLNVCNFDHCSTKTSHIYLILALSWCYTQGMLSDAIHDFLTKAVDHCQTMLCFFKTQRGAPVPLTGDKNK